MCWTMWHPLWSLYHLSDILALELFARLRQRYQLYFILLIILWLHQFIHCEDIKQKELHSSRVEVNCHNFWLKSSLKPLILFIFFIILLLYLSIVELYYSLCQMCEHNNNSYVLLCIATVEQVFSPVLNTDCRFCICQIGSHLVALCVFSSYIYH